MTISYDKLLNAGGTFPAYPVKSLYVLSNSVLKMKYILLNAQVLNHAVIESHLGTHMYASAP